MVMDMLLEHDKKNWLDFDVIGLIFKVRVAEKKIHIWGHLFYLQALLLVIINKITTVLTRPEPSWVKQLFRHN